MESRVALALCWLASIGRHALLYATIPRLFRDRLCRVLGDSLAASAHLAASRFELLLLRELESLTGTDRPRHSFTRLGACPGNRTGQIAAEQPGRQVFHAGEHLCQSRCALLLQ